MASVGIPFAEMWEWPRSGINRAAHDLPPGWGGRPLFLRAFLRAASESAPTGRWAALQRSEAGRMSDLGLTSTEQQDRALSVERARGATGPPGRIGPGRGP